MSPYRLNIVLLSQPSGNDVFVKSSFRIISRMGATRAATSEKPVPHGCERTGGCFCARSHDADGGDQGLAGGPASGFVADRFHCVRKADRLDAHRAG
jgi:hypothetical protein